MHRRARGSFACGGAGASIIALFSLSLSVSFHFCFFCCCCCCCCFFLVENFIDESGSFGAAGTPHVEPTREYLIVADWPIGHGATLARHVKARRPVTSLAIRPIAGVRSRHPQSPSSETPRGDTKDENQKGIESNRTTTTTTTATTTTRRKREKNDEKRKRGRVR